MIALACTSISAAEGLVAGVLAGAMIGAFGGTVFEIVLALRVDNPSPERRSFMFGVVGGNIMGLMVGIPVGPVVGAIASPIARFRRHFSVAAGAAAGTFIGILAGVFITISQQKTVTLAKEQPAPCPDAGSPRT